MKHSKIILLFIFLTGFTPTKLHYDFESEYRFEIINAEEHYRSIRSDINRQSLAYNTDSLMISAILSPELVRYSIYRDFFETKVLEFYYVRDGVQAADFSIGIFQMKPSFVEQLEAEVVKQKELKNKYDSLLQYEPEEIQAIRQERLNRLKNKTWQIRYANCFFSLMEIKFKKIVFKTNEDKLKFYASAYNHGFNCSEKEIRKWITIKSYPNGYGNEKSHYCYADVAVYFYRNFKNTKL